LAVTGIPAELVAPGTTSVLSLGGMVVCKGGSLRGAVAAKPTIPHIRKKPIRLHKYLDFLSMLFPSIPFET